LAHTWTPMRALQRSVRPGEYLMFDRSRKIAVLLPVVIGPKRTKLIRVVTWAERSEDRALIGYFPDMETAAWLTWQMWVKANPSSPVDEAP